MTKILISIKHTNYLSQIRKIIFLFFFSLTGTWLLTSCTPTPDLPEFDEKAWQQDIRSCQNIRPQLAAPLKKNIPKLIGLNHNAILDLFGKPEGNSLEKSGERVYYYYIQPGVQCQNKNSISQANKVFIRFDALDRVYKVRFEREI